jgi:putative NADH-flavin reductase
VKLTIFAATGGIGRLATEQAVAAGHDVTAVARNPQNLPPGTAQVITADLAAPDPAALQAAVAGADAVLSGLGPRGKPDAGITSRGTRAIVAAMDAAGVRRLIVVSAAPVGTVPSPGRPRPPRTDPGDGYVQGHLVYPVLKAALRGVYADLAQMEDVLRDSDLDWTSVRPVRLTGHPATGRYRTALGRNLRGGRFISRADVAGYMLRVIGAPDTFRQSVGIAN